MLIKKLVVAIALAGIAASAQAQRSAQPQPQRAAAGAQEQWYGSIGLVSVSNWGTGFSLAGGMNNLAAINLGTSKMPVGAEAGYVNFGKKTYWGVSASARALYGAAVGSIGINNQLTGVVKLGLTQITADACTPAIPPFIPAMCGSGSSTGLLLAGGIQYSLSKAASIGADYSIYDSEGVLGINATIRF